MPEHENFMAIGPYVLPVEYSALTAILSTRGFYWQIKIRARGRIGPLRVEPFAYSENLIPLFNRPVQTWQDVLCEDITWTECFDEGLEEWNAKVAYSSHDEIDEGLIRFTAATGMVFRIEWSGVCEDTGGEFFQDLDEIVFCCNTEMEFAGVVVKGIERDEALTKLREFITNQEYSFLKTQPDGSHIYMPTGCEVQD